MTATRDDITATLEDWSLCVSCGDLFFIVGTVFGDRLQRFADDSLMSTSLLSSDPATLEEGVVAVTANSRYLLGAKARTVSFDAFVYAASLRGKVIGPDGKPVESMALPPGSFGSGTRH